jgi:hypothetical protein
MPLRFSQFRSLRVLDALQPVREAGIDAHAKVLEQRPRSNYRITLPGGGEMDGETIGHVENGHGLFLFPPVGDDGSVQRLFVPRNAYTSFDVGPRIGELLVAQNMVTPQQVEQAADMQLQMRNQKLGDILLMRQVVTADQLLAAIEQQAACRWCASAKRCWLELVTEEQLEDALTSSAATARCRWASCWCAWASCRAKTCRAALARKMGYPLVDVDAFPSRKTPCASCRTRWPSACRCCR